MGVQQNKPLVARTRKLGETPGTNILIGKTIKKGEK